MSVENKAIWLGVLAVAIFSLTVPLMRVATGTAETPQLSAWFIAFGRACLAGALSFAYLIITREPIPHRKHTVFLIITSMGVVIGFPVFMGLALRYVEAIHAAVVLAGLPLTTAVIASIFQKQKPTWVFWLLSCIGFVMIICYILITNPQGNYRIQFADVFTLLAMISASVGYVLGAKLSREIPPQAVICWVIIIALPVNIFGMFWFLPTEPIRFQSWAAFVYLGVFSMWLGFFAWYRALKMGGTVKISQIQLFQPLFSVIAAIPILGETPKISTFVFAFGILLVIYLSKKTGVKN